MQKEFPFDRSKIRVYRYDFHQKRKIKLLDRMEKQMEELQISDWDHMLIEEMKSPPSSSKLDLTVKSLQWRESRREKIARSPIFARNGIAATSQPLVSQKTRRPPILTFGKEFKTLRRSTKG